MRRSLPPSSLSVPVQTLRSFKGVELPHACHLVFGADFRIRYLLSKSPSCDPRRVTALIEASSNPNIHGVGSGRVRVRVRGYHTFPGSSITSALSPLFLCPLHGHGSCFLVLQKVCSSVWLNFACRPTALLHCSFIW